MSRQPLTLSPRSSGGTMTVVSFRLVLPTTKTGMPVEGSISGRMPTTLPPGPITGTIFGVIFLSSPAA